MKMKLYALLYVSFYIDQIYPTDSKITQMIFVERENTHEKTHPSNLIYYVTENNELYYANADQENEKTLLPGQLCEIYEQSTKDKKYRKIDNRIVLIGQPIEIKNENNENIWTMPAVIKRSGLLGKLFRPDLYIVEYKQIDDITLKSEPTFKKKQKIWRVPKDELVPHFVITKIGEGHRTKITKIGLLNANNTINLVSGSEWPTVKRHNIFNDEIIPPAKDVYLADVITNQNNSLPVTYLVTKPPFFKNESTINKNKNLPYLPNISFDPGLFDETKTKPNNYKIIFDNAFTAYKDFFNFFNLSQVGIKHSIYYYSSDYRLALVLLDKAKNKNTWGICYKKNTLSKERYQFIENFLCYSDVPPATAFDFKRYHLFYATYNKNTKQSNIYKIHLRKKLGFEETQKYDDSSSDERE